METSKQFLFDVVRFLSQIPPFLSHSEKDLAQNVESSETFELFIILHSFSFLIGARGHTLKKTVFCVHTASGQARNSAY